MSRKRVLTPFRLLTSQSMGASFTSAASTVSNDDNVGYQVKYTGTPTGTFAIQGTINGIDWEDLALSSTPSAAGAAGSFVVNLNQVPYYQLRLSYTYTSGTGTLDAWIMTKTVGA